MSPSVAFFIPTKKRPSGSPVQFATPSFLRSRTRVGADTESSGERVTAADFNDKIASYYREHSPRDRPPTLTDDELARIRQRRAELFAAWDAVQPGLALELTFDAGAAGR